MEMDWGTAIIGLVSVLLIIVPIIMMNLKRVKKQREMLFVLQESAQQQLCNISKHEFCANFIIGIDEKRNFVFFLQGMKENKLVQWIDLSEISTCQISKKSRADLDASTGLGLTKQINIVFKPKNQAKGEITLELYREKNNGQLEGELQLAENWSKLISTRLKNI